MELPDNPQEEAEPKPQEEPVAATSAPPVNECTTKETPDSAPIFVPDAPAPDTPLPTTKTAPPQPESCPTATMEPSAHPDLPAEPTIAPLTDPTPEPKPSEILHMNEKASPEAEAAAIDLPLVTTLTTDPTSPHLSRAS